ncbi:MAG: ABC transporter permease [Candidatus Limnocylindrales bacterium]
MSVVGGTVRSEEAAPRGFGAREGFDPARAERGSLATTWRAFSTAARLGWQMEANWTDPLLFFIYSVAKPLASALILVVMVQIISGGGPGAAQGRAFVVIGTALWSFVISGVQGVAWSVLDDRERYRTLKYLYVSPSDFLVVLLGRGVARVAVGGMGAVITLAAGVLFLGVPFELAAVDWPLFALVMLGGLTAIVALGVLMAAICLQTRQESWSYPEAVAGALFLIVGAIFPLAVLPSAVQAVGLIVPLTWWIAGVRQALFPASASSLAGPGSLFTQLTGQSTPSSLTIVLALLATTTLVTLLAAGLFRVSEARAKDRGLIDRTTGS